jgi:hypothetical protein
MSFVPSGHNSDAKVIKYIPASTEGEPALFWLTNRQRGLLLSMTEYLRWQGRYRVIPDELNTQDKIDEYVSSLELRLMEMVDFCEQVLDCVENNTAVQNAITNLYNSQSTNKPLPAAISSQNLLPENTGCNLDILFGSIVFLIDGMNANNQDAFQIIETASNPIERLALVISSIPVLETLPVDEFIDYVQTILTDDLFEAYLATDTQGYRDEITCDLFCIGVGNGCSISINDVFEYFISRVSGSVEDTLTDIITYMISGTWTGTEVNDLFYAAQALFIKYGNKFFSVVGIRTFEIYLKLGADNPSEAWLTLCPECVFWEHTFDFSIDEQGWLIYNEVGHYESGVGFDSDGFEHIWLYRPFSITTRVTMVGFTQSGTTNWGSVQVATPNPELTVFVQSDNVSNPVDITAISGFNGIDEIVVRPVVDGIAAVTGYLTSITLTGYGTEPTW